MSEPMDDALIARAHDLTGAVLGGRYEVLGKLGVGGMASVYEGRRVGLHNRVAIKVLRSELCEDPSNVKRFLREARASSVIEHENIVDIVDFGSTESLPVYFVMEFLEGTDLRQEIKENGAMTWERARPILQQIVSALAAAHNKAIVHRDIKPANIFIINRAGGNDYVKVLDFGIAKIIEDTMGGLTHANTATNGLLGTVAYMAPEQARGGTIDARTDIYAVGVVAYQLLTGRVPFKGNNPYMVLEQHVNEKPKPPTELVPEIPALAETIILRCLEKEASDRYGSMAELADVLLHARTGDYATSAPVSRTTGTNPVWPAPAPAPVARHPSSAHSAPHSTEAMGSGASSSGYTPSSTTGPTDPARDPAAANWAQNTAVATARTPARHAPRAAPVVPPRRSGVLVALLVVAGLIVMGSVGAAWYLRRPKAPEVSAPVSSASVSNEGSSQDTPEPVEDATPVEQATPKVAPEDTPVSSEDTVPPQDTIEGTAPEQPTVAAAESDADPSDSADTSAPEVTPPARPTASKKKGRRNKKKGKSKPAPASTTEDPPQRDPPSESKPDKPKPDSKEEELHPDLKSPY